jgi:hypothetical protein
MSDFKFLRGEQERMVLTFNPPVFQNNVEFCFQFNDNEPIVFGTGPNELRIQISPTPNGNITFTDNDRVFKIFARETI